MRQVAATRLKSASSLTYGYQTDRNDDDDDQTIQERECTVSFASRILDHVLDAIRNQRQTSSLAAPPPGSLFFLRLLLLCFLMGRMFYIKPEVSFFFPFITIFFVCGGRRCLDYAGRDSHRSIIYSNLGSALKTIQSRLFATSWIASNFQSPNVRWWGQNRRETAENGQQQQQQQKKKTSQKSRWREEKICGSAMERDRRSTTWLPPPPLPSPPQPPPPPPPCIFKLMMSSRIERNQSDSANG